MVNKKYSDKMALNKNTYITRLAKGSGVPKTQVRKVIDAMPDVIFAELYKCHKVKLVPGIILSGELRDKEHMVYCDNKDGKKMKTMKGQVRLKCSFTPTYRIQVNKAYEEYIAKEEQKE